MNRGRAYPTMQTSRRADLKLTSASVLSLAWRRAGRLLVAVMGALLLAMPWTESQYNWDHFLRGGQDLELGLLALGALLCLVILLCLDGKRLVSGWLRLREFFMEPFSTAPRQTGMRRGGFRFEGVQAVWGYGSLNGWRSLPLRI